MNLVVFTGVLYSMLSQAFRWLVALQLLFLLGQLHMFLTTTRITMQNNSAQLRILPQMSLFIFSDLVYQSVRLTKDTRNTIVIWSTRQKKASTIKGRFNYIALGELHSVMEDKSNLSETEQL